MAERHREVANDGNAGGGDAAGEDRRRRGAGCAPRARLGPGGLAAAAARMPAACEPAAAKADAKGAAAYLIMVFLTNLCVFGEGGGGGMECATGCRLQQTPAMRREREEKRESG